MTGEKVISGVEKTTEIVPIKQNFADAVFEWGMDLYRQGVISEQENGSLSYRHGLGFVITARDANMRKLTEADLVFVEGWDFSSGRLTVRGKRELPPESLLHAVVYQNRGGAIFTVFTTAPQILKAASRLELPIANCPQPMDALVWASEVEEKLRRGNLMVVSNKGVLSLGCTVEDASRQLLNLVENPELEI